MRLLPFVAIIALAMCVEAAPKQPAKPITTPNGFVCRTKQQDLELRDWIAGIMNQAHKAQGEAKSARDSEAEVKSKLSLASQDGLQLARERDQAIIDKNHVLKKLHFLKFAISGLATLLIIFVMLKLMIPPPLSFYIGGAAIVAVNVAIWTLL